MDRVKLEIKRIENNKNRQITFSKRKNGLIKKAYELSVLCDIDIALGMFSPSGRLSHFSGKKRIEEVFARFVHLTDQEREHALAFAEKDTEHSVLQNREYLYRTLKQLRSENDMVLQLANPAAIKSDTEELQQKICRLGKQLQAAEQQIRFFEPDPLRITSMEELESCEKNLLDTLTHVTQKKNYLLGNQLSSFDPSCLQGMATSFHNEVRWLPDGGHEHAQIFDASTPLIPLRELSAAKYDSLTQGSSSNMDPNSMVECHMGDPASGNVPGWPPAYTSTAGLYSTILSPTLLHPIQPGMPSQDVPPMMACDQVEMPMNSQDRSDNEAAKFEGKVPQFNTE